MCIEAEINKKLKPSRVGHKTFHNIHYIRSPALRLTSTRNRMRTRRQGWALYSWKWLFLNIQDAKCSRHAFSGLAICKHSISAAPNQAGKSEQEKQELNTICWIKSTQVKCIVHWIRLHFCLKTTRTFSSIFAFKLRSVETLARKKLLKFPSFHTPCCLYVFLQGSFIWTLFCFVLLYCFHTSLHWK